MELLPELVRKSRKTLARHFPEAWRTGQIVIHEGDGWRGDPTFQPNRSRRFDIINVGATAEEIPADLYRQLAAGG